MGQNSETHCIKWSRIFFTAWGGKTNWSNQNCANPLFASDTCSLTVWVYRSTIWFYTRYNHGEYALGMHVRISPPCRSYRIGSLFRQIRHKLSAIEFDRCAFLLAYFLSISKKKIKTRNYRLKSLHILSIYCYELFSRIIFHLIKLQFSADQIFFLRNGRWQKVGRPKEIIALKWILVGMTTMWFNYQITLSMIATIFSYLCGPSRRCSGIVWRWMQVVYTTRIAYA